MTTDEDFAALRCVVNYARSLARCTLGQAKTHALSQGFSAESVDNAVHFWADYEARKRERR